MKLLILTITACLAFLVWGTVIVLRVVPYSNYHDPKPLTVLEVYESCMSNTAGNRQDINITCAKLAGIK